MTPEEERHVETLLGVEREARRRTEGMLAFARREQANATRATNKWRDSYMAAEARLERELYNYLAALEQDDPIAWANEQEGARIAEAVTAERDRGRAVLLTAKDTIDKDRSGMAHALARIVDAVTTRSWLLEGRGPYEWNDDKCKDQAGEAMQEVSDIAKAALSASGTLADKVWRDIDKALQATVVGGATEPRVTEPRDGVRCYLSDDADQPREAYKLAILDGTEGNGRLVHRRLAGGRPRGPDGACDDERQSSPDARDGRSRHVEGARRCARQSSQGDPAMRPHEEATLTRVRKLMDTGPRRAANWDGPEGRLRPLPGALRDRTKGNALMRLALFCVPERGVDDASTKEPQN